MSYQIKVAERVEKVGDETDIDSFMKMYDDLAEYILEDERPDRGNYGRSCAQITEAVCQIMGWMNFDLFEPHDFAAAYEKAEPSNTLAYSMIAFLRAEVFRHAEEIKMGHTDFNNQMQAHSEMWHKKLSDQWTAIRVGEPAQHNWIN